MKKLKIIFLLHIILVICVACGKVGPLKLPIEENFSQGSVYKSNIVENGAQENSPPRQ